MKKKFIIKVKTPANEKLTKLRVHTSLDKATLWDVANKQYDGDVVAEVSLDYIEDKKKHFFGVEYYSPETGQVLRPVQPIPRTMINDMGPWELLGADKIQQGDEEFGILDDHVGNPAYPFIPLEIDFARAWRKLMEHVVTTVNNTHITAYASSLLTMFTSNQTNTLNPGVIDGEIVLSSVQSGIINSGGGNGTNAVYAMYDFLKAYFDAPESLRRVEINGFIWEFDWFWKDQAAKWLDALSMANGSYPLMRNSASKVVYGGTFNYAQFTSYQFIPTKEAFEFYNRTLAEGESRGSIPSGEHAVQFLSNQHNPIEREYSTVLQATNLNTANFYAMPLLRYIGPA